MLISELKCFDPLITLKLFALPSLYRQGSFERVGIYENDLASLIYAYNPNIEALLKELSGHLNDSDMAEARQIVKDVEARIQKLRKASG